MKQSDCYVFNATVSSVLSKWNRLTDDNLKTEIITGMNILTNQPDQAKFLYIQQYLMGSGKKKKRRNDIGC